MLKHGRWLLGLECLLCIFWFPWLLFLSPLLLTVSITYLLAAPAPFLCQIRVVALPYSVHPSNLILGEVGSTAPLSIAQKANNPVDRTTVFSCLHLVQKGSPNSSGWCALNNETQESLKLPFTLLK